MSSPLVVLPEGDLPALIRESLRAAFAQSTVVLATADKFSGIAGEIGARSHLTALDEGDLNEFLIRIANHVAVHLCSVRDKRSAVLMGATELVMLHAALERDAISTKHVLARVSEREPNREEELRSLMADQFELLGILESQIGEVIRANGAEMPLDQEQAS